MTVLLRVATPWFCLDAKPVWYLDYDSDPGLLYSNRIPGRRAGITWGLLVLSHLYQVNYSYLMLLLTSDLIQNALRASFGPLSFNPNQPFHQRTPGYETLKLALRGELRSEFQHNSPAILSGILVSIHLSCP